MKQTKRILSLLLSLCLVLGLIPGTAFAAGGNLPFTDVNTTDWCYDAVQYAYEKGMMNGSSTTTFSPDGTTTSLHLIPNLILSRDQGRGFSFKNQGRRYKTTNVLLSTGS